MGEIARQDIINGIVHGYPMTVTAQILAALVIRLGGKVELTPTEIRAMQGVLIDKGTDGAILIEANTDPCHGILGDAMIQ